MKQLLFFFNRKMSCGYDGHIVLIFKSFLLCKWLKRRKCVFVYLTDITVVVNCNFRHVSRCFFYIAGQFAAVLCCVYITLDRIEWI